jgi:hypothetical protein
MKRVIIAICGFLLWGWPVASQALDFTNIITHQGAGQFPSKICGPNSNLTPDVFTLLSADNAGQPCKVGPNDSGCNPNSSWNYTVHGHVTLVPPSSGTTASSVEVQTYISGPGFSCTGTSTLTCTGPYVLAEDSTYAVGTATESIPFDLGQFLLDPIDSSGGANYHSYFVFAKPNNGSVQCIVNDYVTTEHN